MKKLLLALLLLPLTSFATDWILIAGSGANSTKLDTASIKRSGTIVTFWTVENFSPKDQYGNSSYKSQSMIDCRTSQLAAKQLQSFSGADAKGIQNYSQQAPFIDWVPIPIDSIGAKLMAYVCKSESVHLLVRLPRS
ncbi:surface-adhesin E family protein [Polynucleobacter antarcticus]|uniref:surface-adhesin E family protein n=1 Tax=Polynucleobacter antarcticus TaxID=1743162 RepID=UPI0039F11393